MRLKECLYKGRVDGPGSAGCGLSRMRILKSAGVDQPSVLACFSTE